MLGDIEILHKDLQDFLGLELRVTLKDIRVANESLIQQSHLKKSYRLNFTLDTYSEVRSGKFWLLEISFIYEYCVFRRVRP